MPNYLEYQKSISKELLSIKGRLRNFIDDHHWPEDGRYKEIILTDILRKHLPKSVSVGTGFVVNLGEQVTSKATRNHNAASKKLISRKSSKIKGFRFHGGIAQLGERLNGIQEVSGSIPLISTNNRP